MIRSSIRHSSILAWNLQQKFSKQDNVDKGILSSISVQSLSNGKIDHRWLQKQSLQSLNLDLSKERMFLMESDMGYVNRGRAYVFELLLQLEETIFDFLLDVIR